MEGDALALPWRPPRRPVQPRRTAVWVRLDGKWRRGWIRHWERADDGGWAAWLMYTDEEPGSHFGFFSYTPETIVPKDSDTPPA